MVAFTRSLLLVLLLYEAPAVATEPVSDVHRPLAGLRTASAQSDSKAALGERKACLLSPREVIEEFTNLLFTQKQVRLAFETWVDPSYVQHKPMLPNGREPVIEFLEKLFLRHPERIYSIHRIIADDDLVAVHYHSQATPEDPGVAVIDIFRVENCRLVEHWDVVQPVPVDSRNDNTMF